MSSDAVPRSQAIIQRLRVKLIDSPMGRFNLANTVLNIAILSCAYLQQVSDTRWYGSMRSKDVILIDTIQDSLPLDPIPLIAANIFVLTGLVFTVLGLLVVLPSWPHRLLALQRVFWVLSFVLLFRSLSISMTVPVPPRGSHCDAVITTGLPWYTVLGNTFLVLFGVKVPCTPSFPSNNAILLTTFLYQWIVYVPDKRIIAYAWTHWLAGCVLTVIARIDYTSGVLLGVVITWLSFKLYFLLQWMAVYRHSAVSEPSRLAERILDEGKELGLRPLGMELGWMVSWVSWMDGLDLRIEANRIVQSRDIEETLVVEGDREMVPSTSTVILKADLEV